MVIYQKYKNMESLGLGEGFPAFFSIPGQEKMGKI